MAEPEHRVSDAQPLRDAVAAISGASRRGTGSPRTARSLGAARFSSPPVVTTPSSHPLRTRNLGVDALVLSADVRDEEEVQKLAQTALDAFGQIDAWRVPLKADSRINSLSLAARDIISPSADTV